ncbi:MAG: hypothetical protein WAW61_09235, partial [Methylococcaceae bacterium]
INILQTFLLRNILMETYLPIIKTLLSDWFQLTLDNPLYAAALATVVWLLTAIVYSIKIAFLKKKNIASEKARIDLQNNLNTAQQQMQLMQEQLAANTGQMEKAQHLAQNETERAAGLEEQISQRNKQIAGIIQSMATSFDLGERPLPVTEDIKAEGLWQQHDRVIALLTSRLRSEQQAKTELQQTYQAETAKRAEKEALIETLQTTLVNQANQVAKLEQMLEEQKSLLLQQQDKAQQELSQTLEEHLTELARLTELEQQALDLVNTRQQLTQLEEKLNVKDVLITQLEKNKPDDQVKVQPQPAVIKQQEETLIELKQIDEEVPATASDIGQQPVTPVKEQTSGVTGKLKGLFGKTKQEPITTEPESVKIKQDEPKIQPAPPLELEKKSVSAAKGQFGKLKNLFGSKQQAEETKQDEAEIPPAPVSPVKDRYGKKKYYFGDIKQQAEDTKQDETETQPAALEDQQPSLSTAKGQLGKLKNLFGSQQKPKDKMQDEAEIPPAPVEVEQPSVSPAKSQLGKLKNLFGKNK